MKIRKYRAPTMREALAEAKRELGADALIVATRELRRGLLGVEVEVTAAIDDGHAEPDVAPAQAYGPAGHAPAPRRGLDDGEVEKLLGPLRAELRSLRSMVRPLGDVSQELAALRTRLGPAAPAATALDRPIGAASTAPSTRRIVVIVGPTGVGKTTTIAKLAARAALVERRKVALISVDDYRVGGAEQIRTYADLIGVPLRLAEPADLRTQLTASRDADRIFVDTAGRSPRDREAMWSLERALGGLDDVEVHLAVAAGTPAALIDDAAQRHRALGITRLLFTKLDEALDLGELVRAPHRLGLPVTWMTTGQRVPEDLEDATADRIATHLARAATEVAA